MMKKISGKLVWYGVLPQGEMSVLWSEMFMAFCRSVHEEHQRTAVVFLEIPHSEDTVLLSSILGKELQQWLRNSAFVVYRRGSKRKNF